jgi:hypothetical protein
MRLITLKLVFQLLFKHQKHRLPNIHMVNLVYGLGIWVVQFVLLLLISDRKEG